MLQTTYTQARANLAALWDQVTQDREVVVIRRRGSEDVAMIAADELTSLLETQYLLQSSRNADRLMSALTRAQAGTVAPQSIESFRREVGLE